MKKLTIIFAFYLAIFLTACCGAAANDKPTANSTTKTETTSTTAETGVAACDEYLAQVGKLMNNPNVPQATRDAYKQSLEQNRTAWKQAASSPQGKQQLESSCKIALDSIKPTIEQYGK